eukprot:14808904-Alexandrium_andersonii.AAC.1
MDFSFVKFSTTSKSTSYPAKAQSSPRATRRTSSSALQKQHALAFPRANPKLSKTEVYSASHRAGAAR